MAKKQNDKSGGGVNIGKVGGNMIGNQIAGGNLTVGNVTVSDINIGTFSQGDSNDKAELEALVKQLQAELKKLPAEKQEEAEAVNQTTELLVNTAAAEKPNKMMLQITGEGLKKAAENLLGVAPQIGEIAGKIVMKVLTMGG